MRRVRDVVVIGAGVFGAWTAYLLQRSGRSVALIDAYGTGNARASSGGETRLIRCAYGDAEIYTRWACAAMTHWQEFSQQLGCAFVRSTGVLTIGHAQDGMTEQSLATMQQVGVRCERLSRDELTRRYPQMQFPADSWGVLEPDSGVLMARRAVEALTNETVRCGATFQVARVRAPTGRARLEFVLTESNDRIAADTFVFSCGPWLPMLFPDVLGERIHPTRQEVFFFGPPAGDARFAAQAMPAWIDFAAGAYGLPDIERRGVKVAIDRHGPPIDPDRADRVVTPEAVHAVRAIVADRLPALANAPIVETRVCQYENTWNGDFLIDRHPSFDNVFLVGGGSGHGYKHGPMVGVHVKALIDGDAEIDPRFALASKRLEKQRAIF